MTTLIFVRHGQSVSNLEMRFTGQKETLLTELGHAQAQATARFLERYPIDKIYSSDLTRAMQTAEYTAAAKGLPIIPSKAFREINAGLWEGLHYEDLKVRFPESYSRWLQDIGRAHANGGESVLELAARVYAETDRILSENQDKCVAIFTHATPVRMMGCRWFGIAPEDAAQVKFCSNASVSVAEYANNGSFHLVYYGYDGHQGENTTALPKGLA